MAEFDIFQVDAFADNVFTGNPAAVVPLTRWLPDEVLQNIAQENNLAETAFVIPRGAGAYDLRWFTPVCEVTLCGHATLATAHTLYTEFGEEADNLTFDTLSGSLHVARRGDSYQMDFPAYGRQPVPGRREEVSEATGLPVEEVYTDAFLLAVVEDTDALRALVPSQSAIEALVHEAHNGCVLITAPGEGGIDFISRFFAPGVGIPEDPVTGSAHCMLAPYWADRLGKNDLAGVQASPRGGRVACRVDGDRVYLTGRAVTYLRGRISF